MEFKSYHKLPEDSIFIRDIVFVKEQGFEDEFDENDRVAVHIVLYDDAAPIGTCRFYYNKETDSYMIGRFAVVKERRGTSIGSSIMKEAEHQIISLGGNKIRLASQKHAIGFYQKLGFNTIGTEFYEQHCPHIWMEKVL